MDNIKNIKNIWIDIDDTICYYANTDTNTNINTYYNYNLAIPMFDKINIVNRLYDAGHRITMWTARGTVTNVDWYDVTKNQLNLWGVKHHELKMGKPAFDILIDDKALTFLEQVVI
jgi:hypothetical protein